MKTILTTTGQFIDVADDYVLQPGEVQYYIHVKYHTRPGYETVIERISYERALRPAGDIVIKTVAELESETSKAAYKTKKAELAAVLASEQPAPKTEKQILIDEGYTSSEADTILEFEASGATRELAKKLISKFATKTINGGVQIK